MPEIIQLKNNEEIFLTSKNIKKYLKGKNLACWCKKNEFSHCDVLLKIANNSEEIEDKSTEKIILLNDEQFNIINDTLCKFLYGILNEEKLQLINYELNNLYISKKIPIELIAEINKENRNEIKICPVKKDL